MSLETALNAAATALALDGGTVLVRATQAPGTDIPASGEYLMLDLIPGAPTNHFDGTLYEDLNIQVAAWSDVSLTSAIANAEAARGRMDALGYKRSSGIQFLLEPPFIGVATTFTDEAAFDTLT